MTAALATAAAIIVALVAAQAGYLFRRREHLRERRLDAYQSVCAAFLDAARSAADLLSVHTRVSWPRDLSPKTGNEDQRAAMTKAHDNAWQRASADRRSFEIAAYGVELVASKESREAVERLRVFLEGAAYSGTPWRFDSSDHHDYPTAALNPVDIEPKAIEEVGPFVRRAARELWRRDAPEA